MDMSHEPFGWVNILCILTQFMKFFRKQQIYYSFETKFCFSDHCATLTPGPLCGTARCLQSKFCGQVRKNSINLTRKSFLISKYYFIFLQKNINKNTHSQCKNGREPIKRIREYHLHPQQGTRSCSGKWKKGR